MSNAPAASSTTFTNDTKAIVYYLPDTTGWNSMFAGLSNRRMETAGANDRWQLRRADKPIWFQIQWASGQTVVVEACTNLSNPAWQPVQTNTLTTGTSYFSDPQWTNYPGRFYRLRSP